MSTDSRTGGGSVVVDVAASRSATVSPPSEKLVDDPLVDPAAREGGEGADREVADDGTQLVVAEDAARADPSRRCRRPRGAPVRPRDRPATPPGVAIASSATRPQRRGHVKSGREPQVARGGADRQRELAGLEHPIARSARPVGEVAGARGGRSPSRSARRRGRPWRTPSARAGAGRPRPRTSPT